MEMPKPTKEHQQLAKFAGEGEYQLPIEFSQAGTNWMPFLYGNYRCVKN